MYIIILASTLASHIAHDCHEQGARSQSAKGVKVTCILTIKPQVLPVGETPDGEVLLKNDSKETITIVYNSHPWEHLDIEVLNPTGKKINRDRYGTLFAPTTLDPKKELLLKPGETYKFTVNVFATSPSSDRQLHGKYKLTAAYAYKNISAISKSIELEVTAK